MLSDSTEYWWGKIPKDNGRSPERLAKHSANQKKNQRIVRRFKKKYPHLSHTQISLIAKKNGGYQNIDGKDINQLTE